MANEDKIWKFLFDKTNNAYGTAALMGNLMAESSLNPLSVSGVKDSNNYVYNADNGIIDFVYDGHAFGLAQWCYYTRKAGLYKLARSKSMSVGDLDVQLEYLWSELKTYKTAYNAVIEAKNIREASDIVMLKYEKPANTSEAAKQRRADYGQKFYDAFCKPAENSGENKPKTAQKKVVITTDRVNIRAGNGTNYPRVSQVNKNAMYEWIATAENGWYAINLPGRVAWVSGEFSKLI